jgi:DNA-directed RNA polymerase subunit P
VGSRLSEWDELAEVREEEHEEILPYGIKPREVYYMCIYCGNIMSKSELDQHDDIMCSRCGGRIMIKLRSPVLPPRKVYAI